MPGLLATSIAVGDESACAITSASTLRCWGSNSSGQLASSFGFPQAFANITVTVSGRANVGETIFAATSSNEPYSVSSYSWFKSSDGKNAGTQITDATAISYVPAATELGKYFSVGVVLTKWGCTSTTFKSAMFGPTLAAIRILQSSVPTITGKFKSGQLLFARAGTWDSGVVFTYQWYRGTAKITGAKSAIYKLGAADVGKQISVWVTGSKPGLPKVVKKSVKSSKVTR